MGRSDPQIARRGRAATKNREGAMARRPDAKILNRHKEAQKAQKNFSVPFALFRGYFQDRWGTGFKAVGEYTHPTLVLAFLAAWRFNCFCCGCIRNLCKPRRKERIVAQIAQILFSESAQSA
jgi:hypothetical protein